MNPATQTLNAAPTLVQDVKAPTQLPASVKTEVVEAIPVKAQASGGPQIGSAVINPLTHNPGRAPASDAKNLDHILKEVNKDVKKIGQPAASRFSLADLKAAGLILPAIVAVLAAAILVIVTVKAFQPPVEHLRTRSAAQLTN